MAEGRMQGSPNIEEGDLLAVESEKRQGREEEIQSGF